MDPYPPAQGVMGVGQLQQPLPALPGGEPDSSHNRRITSGGPVYASYARIASTLLESTHTHFDNLDLDDQVSTTQ